MRILVFDNYDSFTYNLVHLVEKLTDAPVDVFRNDQVTLGEIAKYDKILLSPGPGLPENAGLMPELVKEYAAKKSILGVCLGHQAIGEAFGGKLVNLSNVYHGVATEITVRSANQPAIRWDAGSDSNSGSIPSDAFSLQPSRLFNGLPEKFLVGRYHSWVVSEKGFPDELEITAIDENGFVMGLQHRNFDVQGVQFHPESILTPDGETIIANWLKQ